MKPAMISFMGLDGSGKSTSIDYAYEQLKKRGYKVEIVRAAYADFVRATTVTDTYHETKTRFAWVGEVQNERLQAGLEKLSVADLKLLTLYAYEGYTVTEISKVLGVSHPTISIKIKRITNFLKNFDFNATN